MGVFHFFSKERKDSLDQGLKKTKEGLISRISRAIAGKSVVDEEVLDGLEEALIASDLGLETTVAILARLEQRVARDKYLNTAELNGFLKEEMIGLPGGSGTPADFDAPLEKKPYVILVVGVNGVGKTTTIGKLAYQYKKARKSVLMAAGDTFRAAAIDQLAIWSERVGVPLVKQAMGSDPGAVAFDAIQSGIARNLDLILIDTAGRLHNKVHLMDELAKIRRVMKKILPDAPHEVLLVLDGSTGQNALEQARQFTAVTEVTAIAVTKLDGTAKGGIVLAISAQLKIPVKYIGVGERMEDLQCFHLPEFVDSLLA